LSRVKARAEERARNSADAEQAPDEKEDHQ
jgi:hypothetical protein